jgi:archaellum component FlaG (FlaF/FlaG flagellin family)
MKFLINILVFCSAISLFSKPVINFTNVDENNMFDWGNVSPKQKILNATIYIKNTGDDTLKISDVHPACGCTSAPLEKYNIAPGDSSALYLSFNTRGYTGQVTKAITVYTNDENAPEIYLVIRANIIYPISCLPNRYIIFDNMQVGVSQDREIKLVNTTDKDIIIENVETSNHALSVNLKNGDIIKIKDTLNLKASLILQESKEQFYESITIKTNCADDPNIKIMITGNSKK